MGSRRANQAPSPRIDLSSSNAPPPERLPIYAHKNEILEALEGSRVIIVQGETGCGKSTQVPKYILQSSRSNKLVVTQPRRLAAVGVAKRVADELRCEIGGLVGYHIRGERKVTSETQVVFMTTGMLIQELTGFKLKEALPWTHVILDEVHERSIETEFLLVILKHLLHSNPTMRLVCMSATLDARLLQNYFAASAIATIYEESQGCRTLPKEEDWLNGGDWRVKMPENAHNFTTSITSTSDPFAIDRLDQAPVQRAGGKTFEVSYFYLADIWAMLDGYEPFASTSLSLLSISEIFRGGADERLKEVDERLYTVAAYLIKKQHERRDDESSEDCFTFLVFLPGMHEINLMNDLLRDIMSEAELDICLLHSSMPEELHGKVFDKLEPGKRRVILSTNIAESSLTLPDVRFVIDFGYTKEIIHNSKTMTQGLELKWASKATMHQRAGRAGRVAKGKSYRLMLKEFYDEVLSNYSKPEIQRCPLDKLILKVKLFELGSPREILGRALQPPNLDEVERTELYLQEMGGLDDLWNITWLGKKYSDMPCDLKVTRLCFFGYMFGCMREALVIASALAQDRSLLVSPTHARMREAAPSEIYAARLIFDNYADSDSIACLNAYSQWYILFGREVKNQIRLARMRGRNYRPRPSFDEIKWCKRHFVELNVLRDMLTTYDEFKQRFKQMSTNPRAVNSSVFNWKIEPGRQERALNTVKLAIAAAFCGTYIVCKYDVEDSIARKKLMQRIGSDPARSMRICNLPDCIEAENIKEVLKSSRDQGMAVKLEGNSVLVNFSPEAMPRALQMSVWLGNYSARYHSGDFLVFKRTWREKDTNRLLKMEDLNVRQWFHHFAKVPKLEGSRQVIDRQEEYRDHRVIDEAICLTRPEVAFKLKFSDLLTQFDVDVEESSVNYASFEPDERQLRSRAFVCCDYTEKRTRTATRTTTALPRLPLVQHILTLTFSRTVELFPDSKMTRYDCYKVSHSDPIYFEHTLSGRDIDDINKVRYQVSKAVHHDIDFEIAGAEVKRLLFGALFRRRLPVLRSLEHWRNLIRSDEASQAYRHSETGPEVNLNDYLKAIPRLPILEDSRIWSPEAEAMLLLETQDLRARKQVYIAKLMEDVRSLELKEAEIVCKSCKASLCRWNRLEIVDSASGVFVINCNFGMVNFVTEVEPVGFVEHFRANFGLQPEQWASCLSDHVFGWVVGGRVRINAESPIQILFPTMVFEDWKLYLWNDDFRELRRMAEHYSRARERNPIPLKCELCAVHFNSEREMSRHFFFSEEHAKHVTLFLEDFA
jgi:HrpA-like RNA helicase